MAMSHLSSQFADRVWCSKALYVSAARNLIGWRKIDNCNFKFFKFKLSAHPCQAYDRLRPAPNTWSYTHLWHSLEPDHLVDLEWRWWSQRRYQCWLFALGDRRHRTRKRCKSKRRFDSGSEEIRKIENDLRLHTTELVFTNFFLDLESQLARWRQHQHIWASSFTTWNRLEFRVNHCWQQECQRFARARLSDANQILALQQYRPSLRLNRRRFFESLFFDLIYASFVMTKIISKTLWNDIKHTKRIFCTPSKSGYSEKHCSNVSTGFGTGGLSTVASVINRSAVVLLFCSRIAATFSGGIFATSGCST